MTPRRQLLLVSLLTLVVFLPGLASYTLWDPWETHYGEVARRMLQDHDYVRLNHEAESFRSKPVLTFWLMAAGMKALGVAEDGGFSGEMVSTPRVEWALRLPFALAGCAGIVIMWLTLARFLTRRTAWIAAAILASSPYYFFITRQAITDMPSCTLLVASIALLVYALFDDRPLATRRPAVVVGATLAVVVGVQVAYYLAMAGGGVFALGKRHHLPGWLPLGAFVPALAAALWWVRGIRTTRQVYLWWFYIVNGVAVLAKGPVAPAMAGLTALGYLAVTGEWRRLRELEIGKGVAIAVLVALPWHFAIYILDGPPWLEEYVGVHLLGRTFLGTYGDRGTFAYYFQEMGYGMWPWVCLVPAALAAFMLAGRPRTRDDKLRALFFVWAVTGFAFFAFVRTKFHHYLLPTVPAFATIVAVWLDDAWAGRRSLRIAAVTALPLLAVTAIDLVARQEELVHLFCFKYDRPWPYGDPWNVDLSRGIVAAAALFGATMALSLLRRRAAIAAMSVAGVLFALWGMDVFLMKASPHWGMRALLERYYRDRKILGVDIIYGGPGPLEADWAGAGGLDVRSVIPATLRAGDPMKVTWRLGAASGTLAGKVASIDAPGNRFRIDVAPDDALRRAVAENAGKGGGARLVALNADRLVAWQLRWRGENFYSGGEIWKPPFDDMKTVFVDVDNAKFAAWLKPQLGSGRTYFLITEIERVKRLRDFFKGLSPQPSMEEIDQSNNKYGMVRFSL
jgi:4-amino-4-deoxy-L-arabinose transferase-like glycosyltransferase